MLPYPPVLYRARSAAATRWLVLASLALVGCASEVGEEGDDLGFRASPVSAMASPVSAMVTAQSYWPIDAVGSWTYFDSSTEATTTARFSMAGTSATLSGFPGVTGSMPLYLSGSAIFGGNGTTMTKLFDFAEGVGMMRTLPSSMPAGFAGATITLASTTYQLYDHLNGRTFNNCARYTLAPPTGVRGITEIVFAPSVGPVLIRSNEGGSDHWWFLKTATTSSGSVSLPAGPTIPPTTRRWLPIVAPGRFIITPGDELGERGGGPVVTPISPEELENALNAVDVAINNELAAENATMSSFYADSAAQGFRIPLDGWEGRLLSADEVDVGAASWPPDVLARYPTLPGVTAKSDQLATLNNQIWDYLGLASADHGELSQLLNEKRENLRTLRRLAAASLAFEQAAYRREVTGLYVGFTLGVAGAILTGGATSISQTVVSRMVTSRIAAVTPAIQQLVRASTVARASLAAARTVPGSPAPFYWIVRMNRAEASLQTLMTTFEVSCVRKAGGGLVSTGKAMVGGSLWRMLGPNQNNPFEVAMEFVEQQNAKLVARIGALRGMRSSDLGVARRAQEQYLAAMQTTP